MILIKVLQCTSRIVISDNNNNSLVGHHLIPREASSMASYRETVSYDSSSTLTCDRFCPRSFAKVFCISFYFLSSSSCSLLHVGKTDVSIAFVSRKEKKMHYNLLENIFIMQNCVFRVKLTPSYIISRLLIARNAFLGFCGSCCNDVKRTSLLSHALFVCNYR